MIAVIDASVILKWLIADPEREPETGTAIRLMQTVANGEIEVLQPIHWLIEVVGVLSRLSPERAGEDALMLQAMKIPTTDHPAVLQQAIQLARESQQHLFDTLYHAVALESADGILITADERYLSHCRRPERVVPLAAWHP